MLTIKYKLPDEGEEYKIHLLASGMHSALVDIANAFRQP